MCTPVPLNSSSRYMNSTTIDIYTTLALLQPFPESSQTTARNLSIRRTANPR